jgi:hypothetical protein
MILSCAMWSNGFCNTLDIRPAIPEIFWAVVVCAWLIGVVGLLATSLAVAPLRVFCLVAAASVLLLRGWRRAAIVKRLTCSSSGHWQLTLARGRRVRVELEQAWIAGRVVGLGWRAADGRYYFCWLGACDCHPAAWRRLRVLLRFPRTSALT